MKILCISGAPVVGGAERTTLQLCQLWQQRGHHVELLYRVASPVGRIATAAGVPASPAALGGALNLRAAVVIWRALRERAPDIALVTTIDEWVWTGLPLIVPTRARLVLIRFMALPLAGPVRWLANRRADAIVAVSDAARAVLVARPGIDPRRVHVVRVPSRFPPRATVPTHAQRRDARARLGLSEDGHWVAFLGGFSERKGLSDVLAAVARANEQLGPTHLLLCGRRDPLYERARLAAGGLRLARRLHVLGEVDDVRGVMTAADVVVVATRTQLGEALPLTLLEAMACGTPVVGTAVGGIPEAIGRDGEAGRLARADDADDLARVLVELLRDGATAQRLATIALQRVREHFDPQHAAQQYERLFQRLQSARR